MDRISVAQIWLHGISQVNRILKGEKPGDLPVQTPSKYEMVINLKSAKATGLFVPFVMQQRAAEDITSCAAHICFCG